MSDKPNGGPAFPSPKNSLDPAGPMGGMTLRDYFAVEALNGLIVSRAGPMGCQHWHDWAKQAYMFADAMLRAREAE